MVVYEAILSILEKTKLLNYLSYQTMIWDIMNHCIYMLIYIIKENNIET